MGPCSLIHLLVSIYAPQQMHIYKQTHISKYITQQIVYTPIIQDRYTTYIHIYAHTFVCIQTHMHPCMYTPHRELQLLSALTLWLQNLHCEKLCSVVYEKRLIKDSVPHAQEDLSEWNLDLDGLVSLFLKAGISSRPIWAPTFLSMSLFSFPSSPQLLYGRTELSTS